MRLIIYSSIALWTMEISRSSFPWHGYQIVLMMNISFSISITKLCYCYCYCSSYITPVPICTLVFRNYCSCPSTTRNLVFSTCITHLNLCNSIYTHLHYVITKAGYCHSQNLSPIALGAHWYHQKFCSLICYKFWWYAGNSNLIFFPTPQVAVSSGFHLLASGIILLPSWATSWSSSWACKHAFGATRLATALPAFPRGHFKGAHYVSIDSTPLRWVVILSLYFWLNPKKLSSAGASSYVVFLIGKTREYHIKESAKKSPLKYTRIYNGCPKAQSRE